MKESSQPDGRQCSPDCPTSIHGIYLARYSGHNQDTVRWELKNKDTLVDENSRILYYTRAQTYIIPHAEKPGQCPPERKSSSMSNWQPANVCAYDSKCDGDKKCCVDNGFKFCKQPAQERPGTCPSVTPEYYQQCDDNCTSDSECAPDLKCCFHKCGRTCMLPSGKEVSGVCPNSVASCKEGDKSIVCSSNENCPSNSKCCKAQCGMRCVISDKTPLPQKQGFCFQDTVYNCKKAERHFCVNDSFCPNNDKCCPYLCRTQCLPPQSARSGECPQVLTSCKEGDKSIVCSTDQDCSSYKKCCATQCGMRCTAAVNIPTYLFTISGHGV